MSPTTFGVIADTHIPDRAKLIPRAALDLFSNRGVSAILHAGDLSTRQVLDILGEIAPVYAIRGNTDLMLVGQLPWVRRLEIESVTIGIAHGHGNWLRYVPDKVKFILHGPRKFTYYENLARSLVPDCKVVVCGHTHISANYWIDDQLIFNPGSPTEPSAYVPGLPPSVGLLHLDEGNVRGEIVFC
jgi:putative phosphoesterase